MNWSRTERPGSSWPLGHQNRSPVRSLACCVHPPAQPKWVDKARGEYPPIFHCKLVSPSTSHCTNAFSDTGAQDLARHYDMSAARPPTLGVTSSTASLYHGLQHRRIALCDNLPRMVSQNVLPPLSPVPPGRLAILQQPNHRLR